MLENNIQEGELEKENKNIMHRGAIIYQAPG